MHTYSMDLCGEKMGEMGKLGSGVGLRVFGYTSMVVGNN